jgi:hypothetical protein
MPAMLMDPGDVFTCISCIAATLQSEGVNLPCPSAHAAPAPSLVEKLPSQIARFGPLIEGENAWIYCEPRRRTESDPSGQALIHLPAGRYLVDAFDIVLRTCIARESASGNPLVIGLVSVPRPFLLWIRPIRGIEET